jgi:hypothetical protein
VAVVPITTAGKMFSTTSGAGFTQLTDFSTGTGTFDYSAGILQNSNNYVGVLFILAGQVSGTGGHSPPFVTAASATYSGFSCITDLSHGNNLPVYPTSDFITILILCLIPYGASYSGSTLSVTVTYANTGFGFVSNMAAAGTMLYVDRSASFASAVHVANANTFNPSNYTLIETEVIQTKAMSPLSRRLQQDCNG